MAESRVCTRPPRANERKTIRIIVEGHGRKDEHKDRGGGHYADDDTFSCPLASDEHAQRTRLVAPVIVVRRMSASG